MQNTQRPKSTSRSWQSIANSFSQWPILQLELVWTQYIKNRNALSLGPPQTRAQLNQSCFCSTIPSNNKKKLQEHRHAQLLSSYVKWRVYPPLRRIYFRNLDIVQRHIPTSRISNRRYQLVGSMRSSIKKKSLWEALLIESSTTTPREFESGARHRPSVCRIVANMAGFSLMKFPISCLEGPVWNNRMELLRLGGVTGFPIVWNK